MVLHITLSRETSVNNKSPVMCVLATVYRPPGHHTDFIKEFADFLSELVLAADKALKGSWHFFIILICSLRFTYNVNKGFYFYFYFHKKQINTWKNYYFQPSF